MAYRRTDVVIALALLARRIGSVFGQGLSLMTQHRHLIVFAKTPEAGFAKTRLIPALGAQGAAALAKRLFEHTIQRVSPLSLRAKTSLELCVVGAQDDHFLNLG